MNKEYKRNHYSPNKVVYNTTICLWQRCQIISKTSQKGFTEIYLGLFYSEALESAMCDV